MTYKKGVTRFQVPLNEKELKAIKNHPDVKDRKKTQSMLGRDYLITGMKQDKNIKIKLNYDL